MTMTASAAPSTGVSHGRDPARRGGAGSPWSNDDRAPPLAKLREPPDLSPAPSRLPQRPHGVSGLAPHGESLQSQVRARYETFWSFRPTHETLLLGVAIEAPGRACAHMHSGVETDPTHAPSPRPASPCRHFLGPPRISASASRRPPSPGSSSTVRPAIPVGCRREREPRPARHRVECARPGAQSQPARHPVADGSGRLLRARQPAGAPGGARGGTDVHRGHQRRRRTNIASFASTWTTVRPRPTRAAICRGSRIYPPRPSASLRVPPRPNGGSAPAGSARTASWGS
jgi:hypothetical protein